MCLVDLATLLHVPELSPASHLRWHTMVPSCVSGFGRVGIGLAEKKERCWQGMDATRSFSTAATELSSASVECEIHL